VKVGDSLASVFAVVDDHPEAVFGVALLAGDVADPQKEMPEKLLILGFGFRDADEGLLGNEEKVHRGLRSDVAKAEAKIVFINEVCGNLTGDDFFKEGHGEY